MIPADQEPSAASEKKLIARKLMLLFQGLGLKPGDHLPPEQELASRLGISRPVLREALSVLEALGLCHVRKGSGRVLAPFKFGDGLQSLIELALPSEVWLRGLLDLRQALEGAMLARAFPLMNGQTLQQLDRLTVAMEGKAARGEYFGNEDRQFHLALYQALNNDALNGILHLFWAMYDKLDINALRHSQRLDETAAHHRKILSALQVGDIRRAQHQLDAHFYDTSYALGHHETKS